MPTPLFNWRKFNWRDWVNRWWLTLVMSAIVYLASGGKFRAQDGRELAWTLLIGVSLGVPLLWLFRVVVCGLAFGSRVPSYGATAVGVVLTIVLVIALAHIIPKRVGMACLPLGLIGGIAGALEAKDRREACRHWTRNAAGPASSQTHHAD